MTKIFLPKKKRSGSKRRASKGPLDNNYHSCSYGPGLDSTELSNHDTYRKQQQNGADFSSLLDRCACSSTAAAAAAALHIPKRLRLVVDTIPTSSCYRNSVAAFAATNPHHHHNKSVPAPPISNTSITSTLSSCTTAAISVEDQEMIDVDEGGIGGRSIQVFQFPQQTQQQTRPVSESRQDDDLAPRTPPPTKKQRLSLRDGISTDCEWFSARINVACDSEERVPMTEPILRRRRANTSSSENYGDDDDTYGDDIMYDEDDFDEVLLDFGTAYNNNAEAVTQNGIGLRRRSTFCDNGRHCYSPSSARRNAMLADLRYCEPINDSAQSNDVHYSFGDSAPGNNSRNHSAESHSRQQQNSAKRSPYLISAEHPLKLLWDVLTLLLTILNAYATHMAIRDREFVASPLIRVCEVWFIIDIILNFFTERRVNGRRLDTIQKVWARYLTSWFVVDLLSLIPFELCYVQPIIEMQKRRSRWKKFFFRSKAVVRVTTHLKLPHFRLFGHVSRSTGLGGKRLLHLLIKYIPKYLMFWRNMKAAVVVRALRQIHTLRRVWCNVRNSINNNSQRLKKAYNNRRRRRAIALANAALTASATSTATTRPVNPSKTLLDRPRYDGFDDETKEEFSDYDDDVEEEDEGDDTESISGVDILDVGVVVSLDEDQPQQHHHKPKYSKDCRVDIGDYDRRLHQGTATNHRDEPGTSFSIFSNLRYSNLKPSYFGAGETSSTAPLPPDTEDEEEEDDESLDCGPY